MIAEEVGKRELPSGRGPEMDQFGERSEHEQNHITAIANMELEDSADEMLGPATSETGRTRSQH